MYGEDFYYEAIAYTWDLGAGRYALNNLPPGRYRISISDKLARPSARLAAGR